MMGLLECLHGLPQRYPQRRALSWKWADEGDQIHLGDYIYENRVQGERAHQPPKILFSLWDYRTRLGQVSLSCCFLVGLDQR